MSKYNENGPLIILIFVPIFCMGICLVGRILPVVFIYKGQLAWPSDLRLLLGGWLVQPGLVLLQLVLALARVGTVAHVTLEGFGVVVNPFVALELARFDETLVTGSADKRFLAVVSSYVGVEESLFGCPVLTTLQGALVDISLVNTPMGRQV